MWLYFSALTPEGKKRCHTFYSSQIESHFTLLNHFVLTGFELQSAYLIYEGDKRIDLPIEAFDGEPISARIQELEMEYNQVLSL